MMLMMPKSKYLENRIDVKLKTTERERLDSGWYPDFSDIPGTYYICQASQVPTLQELGTLDAVTILKLVNYSFCLTEYLLYF